MFIYVLEMRKPPRHPRAFPEGRRAMVCGPTKACGTRDPPMSGPHSPPPTPHTLQSCWDSKRGPELGGGGHGPELWGSRRRPWHCPSRHPRSHLHAPAAPTARLANATDWETSRSSSPGHMFPSQVLSPFVLCNQSEPEAKTVLEKTQPPSLSFPHPSFQ